MVVKVALINLVYIWKLQFLKNLEQAKILKYAVPQSLCPNHCGPLHDAKTSKFFSHSFSRCNSKKLIRTLILFKRQEQRTKRTQDTRSTYK